MDGSARHSRRWCVALVALLAAGLATALPASATSKVITVECLSRHGQVHRVAPKFCVMYQHGTFDKIELSHIRWRRWGKPRVRGVAVADLKKLVPGDTERYVHYRGRVRIRLSDVVHQTTSCVHGWYYTRAAFTFTTGESEGRRHRIGLPPGCPA